MNQLIIVRYLIPAAASVFVALVTTWGTIYATQNKLENATTAATQLKQQTEKLSDLTGLPIGSIVASAMAPHQFVKFVGDDPAFDIRKSRWTLADGKKVEGTTWAAETKNQPVPDLGGVFLRGINTKDDLAKQDPDGVRQPGAFQPDAYAKHDHGGKRVPWGWLSWRANGKDQFWDRNGGKYEDYRTTEEGGPETRPRNVAVYYYIRVN